MIYIYYQYYKIYYLIRIIKKKYLPYFAWAQFSDRPWVRNLGWKCLWIIQIFDSLHVFMKLEILNPTIIVIIMTIAYTSIYTIKNIYV